MLMDQIKKRGLDARLVAHVHDEVQLEVRNDQAEYVGKLAVFCMKRAGESFKFKCPLDGEFKIGNNWADTH